MSGLKNLENSIRKKMELSDYKAEEKKVEKPEIQKKIKVSFYIPEDVLKMFDKIFAERLVSGNKVDRSVLICEMIKQYYGKGHA